MYIFYPILPLPRPFPIPSPTITIILLVFFPHTNHLPLAA